MKHILIIFLLASFFITSCGPTSSAETASNSQAAYIENKGSDTIVNLALAWAEKYQSEHPDIRISVTGGDFIESESEKNKIKEIVENEDPRKPYSDQRLSELLAKDNIEIARRTVTKYREVLRIGSSSERKRMF